MKLLNATANWQASNHRLKFKKILALLIKLFLIKEKQSRNTCLSKSQFRFQNTNA